MRRAAPTIVYAFLATFAEAESQELPNPLRIALHCPYFSIIECVQGYCSQLFGPQIGGNPAVGGLMLDLGSQQVSYRSTLAGKSFTTSLTIAEVQPPDSRGVLSMKGEFDAVNQPGKRRATILVQAKRTSSSGEYAYVASDYGRSFGPSGGDVTGLMVCSRAREEAVAQQTSPNTPPSCSASEILGKVRDAMNSAYNPFGQPGPAGQNVEVKLSLVTTISASTRAALCRAHVELVGGVFGMSQDISYTVERADDGQLAVRVRADSDPQLKLR